MGAYFFLFDTGLMLQLISFHHVFKDNRDLLKRIKDDSESDSGDADSH